MKNSPKYNPRSDLNSPISSLIFPELASISAKLKMSFWNHALNQIESYEVDELT